MFRLFLFEILIYKQYIFFNLFTIVLLPFALMLLDEICLGLFNFKESY